MSTREKHSDRLRDLPGLGPTSERLLAEVGIHTPADLRAIGPVRAYLQVARAGSPPSLNLLYALAGAVEGAHWLTIARSEKGRLLMELDGYQELEALVRADT